MKFLVTPTGSDTNTGSASSPLKTLTKAVSLAATGDEIVLSGAFTEQNVTMPNKSVRIRSAPGMRSSVIFTGTSEYSLLTSAGSSIHGIDLHRESTVNGNVIGASEGVLVEGCVVSSNSTQYDGIKILGHRVNLLRNRVFDCANQGIDDVAHDGHIIEDNEIYNCANGIVLKGGGSGHTVRGNIVWDCDYAGIQLGGTIDSIWQAPDTAWQVSGCLVEGNTVTYSTLTNTKQGNPYNKGIGGGIRMEGAVSCVISKNVLIECGLTVINSGTQKCSGIMLYKNSVNVGNSDDALISCDVGSDNGLLVYGNTWAQARTVPLFRLGTEWLTETEFMSRI